MDTLVIDIDELSIAIKKNSQTIAKHLSGVRISHSLTGLPRPYVTRPKSLWWWADILAWRDSRRTYSAEVADKEILLPPSPTTILPMPKKRRPGRPTNAERAERGVRA